MSNREYYENMGLGPEYDLGHEDSDCALPKGSPYPDDSDESHAYEAGYEASQSLMRTGPRRR